MLVVDDDGNGIATDCDAVVPTFNHIQAAVNAAAPGDTVFICPGSYDEQVTVVTSELTLRGSGVESTVIQPTVVAQNTVRPGSTFPVKPILLIDGASDVTVTGLTIDGALADTGNVILPTCGGIPFYTGVYYRVSSGTVDAVHITNIKSLATCTFGLLVQTDQTGIGDVADVAITNSLFDHYGMSGINCIGQNTTCSITGNTVRGAGAVDDLLQAGIVIRAEARATISGNVISDHYYLPARGVPESAAGIFLFMAHPETNPHLLRINTFANNQLDVQRIGTAAAWD